MNHKIFLVAGLMLPFAAFSAAVGDGIPVTLSGTITEDVDPPEDVCAFADTTTAVAFTFAGTAGGTAPTDTDTITVECGTADPAEYTLSTSANGRYTSYQVLINDAPGPLSPEAITNLTEEEARLLGISRAQVNMRVGGIVFHNAILAQGDNTLTANLHGVTNPFQLDPEAFGQQGTTTTGPAYPGRVMHYPVGYDYELYIWFNDVQE